MANLIGICADTPAEKQAFLSRLGERLTPFEGLSTGRADWATASFAWAVSPTAPLSVHQEGGDSVWVVGSLGFGHSREAGNARHILETQRRRAAPTLSGLNGYYAALSEDAQGTVMLGTDILGLFPLYYYSTPEVLVFSTTLSVFKLYPGFRHELSVEGLVGILLTNYIIDGQTLLKGVRRLSPGYALQWKKGSGAREVRGDPIVPSDKYFGNPFQKNLEIIDGLMHSAVQRHAGVSDPLFLLSGGLDSRLAAGYAHKVHGRRVRAVTQGRSDDFEMRCAKATAGALGWPHAAYPIEPEAFEACAMKKLEQEHLSCGFSTPWFMQMTPKVQPLGGPIYSGLYGDLALGGSPMGQVLNIMKGRNYSFETHMTYLNRWGISMANIRRLVPESVLKDHLDNAIGKFRDVYHAIQGQPFQRAWLFSLLAVDRYNVGFIPHMLSFGAWPIMPYIDKELLLAVANMPQEATDSRFMQRELLCEKFPDMAVLPLDRNTYDLTPVLGLKRVFRKNHLNFWQTLTALRVHAEGKVRMRIGDAAFKRTGRDHRFYYQTFNINGDAWKSFRRKAEPSRRLLENFFDPKTLGELWPGPSATIQVPNGIIDTYGTKVLLGFAVWAADNL